MICRFLLIRRSLIRSKHLNETLALKRNDTKSPIFIPSEELKIYLEKVNVKEYDKIL